MRRTALFALGAALLITTQAVAQECRCGDCNADGEVTVDEILVTVNLALQGCEPAETTPTPTSTATPVPTTPAPAERFVDNGDGTITDNRTGLTWEKKSDDGSIHDQDNVYTWSDGGNGEIHDPDGTAFTEFIATLNATAFAGRTDWRLPTMAELVTIVDFERLLPATFPNFDVSCTAGCEVAECSCTQSGPYWSDTDALGNILKAWSLHFGSGFANSSDKTQSLYVRAVRDGA